MEESRAGALESRRSKVWQIMELGGSFWHSASGIQRSWAGLWKKTVVVSLGSQAKTESGIGSSLMQWLRLDDGMPNHTLAPCK